MEEIVLPEDPSGFVRRECPHCHRQMKTRPSPSDAVAIARALADSVPGLCADVLGEGPFWHCFYCGKTGPVEEWLTSEQKSFLERVGGILAQHVQYEQMQHVCRTLSDNPHPTYVAVKPVAVPTRMPAEPDDMRRFFLMCCGDEVKAASGWEGSYHCPRCGTEHADGMPKPRPQLAFIRE